MTLIGFISVYSVMAPDTYIHLVMYMGS